MDLSVRELLVAIGVLLAVAVLLDGYRRMRKDRQDTLRLSAKKRSELEDELINPELPGAARVVAVREQPSLHLRRAEQKPSQLAEEGRFAAPDDDSNEPMVALDTDILFTDPADEYRDAGSKPVPAIDDDIPESAPVQPAVPEPAPMRATKPAAERKASNPEYEELFVLNVVADDNKPYKGADLLQVLLGCDLRYGRMKIFHRHEKADGSGKEQFSVANLVEPGNFELDGIEGFSTPGVVFFMNLPGPDDSQKAFDAMLETARCLVKNLGGELRDQTHSIATKQTLEHYKQRIRDFERRQMTLM